MQKEKKRKGMIRTHSQQVYDLDRTKGTNRMPANTPASVPPRKAKLSTNGSNPKANELIELMTNKRKRMNDLSVRLDTSNKNCTGNIPNNAPVKNRR